MDKTYKTEMQLQEEPKTEQKSKTCFKANRCQCAVIVLFILALMVVIGVLAGLYATKSTPDNDDDDVVVIEPTTPVPASKPWENHRLPDYILPDHYDLTLYPDFYDDGDSFTGNVTITLTVTKATRYILIHIRDLTISRTVLKRDGAMVAMKAPFHYLKNEYWVIEGEQAIQPGKVSVELSFSGSLKNGIVGLYKSTYLNSITNQTSHIATSKFQPTDARKAFPCLDEPGLKSNFTITLIHRPGYVALSNMPVASTSTYKDGAIATHFLESVPMVTYLACFIVCDFQYKMMKTRANKEFRVYATPNKINQVDYALDLGVKVLNYFEDYYGLDYPLPKMDMIAIPDFVSGAMEHWGLITYRETNLLYDENEASLANKQRVAVVVAHELAHMWFGNLVTMNWWNDLWLNEGFASFVEYIGVSEVEKNWDMDTVFVSTDLQAVMPDDSKISSHPIIVPVNHPSEITEVFDSISYSKGASVLRMLDAFMGTENFRLGLQNYMQEFQFKTTVTDDLWEWLAKVPGAPPVKAIMDTWTIQMGLPVVKVEVTGTKSVRLTQERFLLDPSADKTQPPSPLKYLWRIPIWYKTQSEFNSTLTWMNNKQLTLNTNSDLITGWIKLNSDQKCYYRVNYPESMWTRISNALQTNHSVFSASDRTGLIDDAFNLASADLLDISLALDLIKYLGFERHPSPWTTVSGRIDYITDMLVTGEHFEKWQKFVRGISTSVLDAIGYKDEGDDNGKLLRGIVLGLACDSGYSHCLRNMTNMFQERLKGNSIPPNIRSAVYKFGMQASRSEEEWNYMWNAYTNSILPQERIRLLYAVTQTREPWLIYRLLRYSMDSSKVRDQDFFSMIAYLSWNRVAHPIAWNFVRANWLTLVDRFNINNRYLGRMVSGIVENFNTDDQLKEVMSFFAQYPEAGAGARAREQSLEQIRNNIAWMKVNEQTISTWLNANIL